MTAPNPAQNVSDRNAKSLRTLSRAIEFSQGQFSLILVRCDYAHLRSQIIAQLQASCPIPITTLVLPDSAKTLFTKIQNQVASLLPEPTKYPPQAMMVVGLESVTAIDQVLTSTNQVREEFRKNCPYPLVLWVDERVCKNYCGWLQTFAPGPAPRFSLKWRSPI